MELRGSEIKSIRNGSVSLAQGFVTVEEGEAYLRDVHIARYKPAAEANHDPDRPRRLLLHRAEIDLLASHVERQGTHGHSAAAVPGARLGQAGSWAGARAATVR